MYAWGHLANLLGDYRIKNFCSSFERNVPSGHRNETLGSGNVFQLSDKYLLKTLENVSRCLILSRLPDANVTGMEKVPAAPAARSLPLTRESENENSMKITESKSNQKKNYESIRSSFSIHISWAFFIRSWFAEQRKPVKMATKKKIEKKEKGKKIH